METLEKIRAVISGTRKGMINIQQGTMLILGLVVIAIVGSIGASVIAANQATQTANSYAYNISGYGLSGLNAFATQLGNIGLVGGLALILVVLFGGLYFLFGKGGR